MVRRQSRYGIAPVTALRMATLNAAEWFGLHDRGAVAPGRRADLIVFDDLAKLMPEMVFAGGPAGRRKRCSTRGGLWRRAPIPATVAGSVNIRWGGSRPARPRGK